MRTGRVVLSKAAPPSIEMKEAPYGHARRWRSEYEEGQARSWPSIFMTQDAYREVNSFAGSSLDREVGGMLIGQVCLTPDGERYVIVEGQLEARHASNGATHMTFTSNTLTDALTRLDEEHPDKQIVGWYHTHPGLSVFLSSMDVWLHSHFFPQPWHVALVIDPLVNHGGFFWYTSDTPGRLHPQHYVGFFEMVPPGSSSVVTWHNMEPAEIQRGPSGNGTAKNAGQIMEGYSR
jgi:proteasome lid subunit RPN8/RPN11